MNITQITDMNQHIFVSKLFTHGAQNVFHNKSCRIRIEISYYLYFFLHSFFFLSWSFISLCFLYSCSTFSAKHLLHFTRDNLRNDFSGKLLYIFTFWVVTRGAVYKESYYVDFSLQIFLCLFLYWAKFYSNITFSFLKSNYLICFAWTSDLGICLVRIQIGDVFTWCSVVKMKIEIKTEISGIYLGQCMFKK